MFLDENARDFRPNAGSPLIDGGDFLTRTIGAGSGTALPLADVLYFSNGFGIEGLLGDVIQLSGQSNRARIVAIDYAQKVLHLDRSLSWAANQGVGLSYEGAGPNIGVYE